MDETMMPRKNFLISTYTIITFFLLFGFIKVVRASGPAIEPENYLNKVILGKSSTSSLNSDLGLVNQAKRTTCPTTSIMPLGDSITVGKSSGVDDPALQISYRKDLWDLLIANDYNVDFVGTQTNGQSYPNFDPNHEGHSGKTDAYIAKNIYGTDGENWLTQNPAEVILLHIGTNALDTSPDDVENILDRVDQYENASGTHVKVVLARIINRIPYSATSTQFNDNVEAMALNRIAAGDDIVIVDMEDGAGIIYDYYDASPPGDMYDYLHPYATGYTKMAAVWYDALIGFLSPCSNQPPDIDAIDNQTNAEGDSVSLAVVASDPNMGDVLTYAASGLPSGLSIDSDSGLIQGLIDYQAATNSPYNVTVTVTDDGNPSLFSQVTFTWTVTNTDWPPQIVSNPGDQLNTVGDVVSLLIEATDPDSNSLIYSASGLPGDLSIDANSGLIAGTVAMDAYINSPYSVMVTVQDDSSPPLADSVSFTWTVSPGNSPPVLVKPGPQESAEGDSISLQVEASDPDAGDNLTFSADGLPEGLTINSVTGLISGIVSYTASVSSPYTVTLSVNDDGLPQLTDVDTFTWSVTNTNRPPQISDPGDQSNAEGDAVSLSIQANDPDGDGLSFNAVGLPAGLEIHPMSGLISGTISYTASGSSPYTVMVTVSDDYSPSANSEIIFSWSVNDTNRPPQIVSNPGDQISTFGDFVSLQINATDPDSNPLTYNASGLPADLSIDSNSGLISGDIAMDAYLSSPYDVTVTVEDDNVPALSDSVSFTWTVSLGNYPPVLVNPGPQADAEGDTVSLQVEASDPDVGDTLLYEASGLPDNLAIGSATGLISGTISYDASAGSPYTVTLSVTDDGLPSLTDIVTFTWTVTNTNRLPEVVNPGDQFNLPGDSVSLQIEASDPDGDELTYAATGLPDALSINPATGVISGTVTIESVGANAVEVVVSDGQDNVTIDFAWDVEYSELFLPIIRRE
jgi:hypothetical protein